jgi:2-keto-4-pentenoate hydratase/2-oxohepta-3-ene-1,7-dioic acid hydratase in catechol pathway
LKPPSSVAYNPTNLSLPIAKIHQVDHEIELGFFLSKGGHEIPK